MGKNFRETLNEQLRDPAFKAEWDALEPERQIMRAILEGRDEQSLTQKQLAEVTGIAQADISRFENGTGNPSLRTLKRLADGLGMRLKVEFVPKNQLHKKSGGPLEHSSARRFNRCLLFWSWWISLPGRFSGWNPVPWGSNRPTARQTHFGRGSAPPAHRAEAGSPLTPEAPR